MSSELSKKFRVVVVGGGPVGLCLAHCLSLAGIDYVLLESRESVIEKSGLGLALWPHGVRILDQLGLLEEGRKLYLPVKDKSNHGPDGSECAYSDLYAEIEKNHGHPWMLFRRQNLLELLYKTLPENDDRILCNKKVVFIDTHADGVTVHCSDGTAEEGSIVVGCDGVHSRSSAKVVDSESPMLAQYQLLAIHIEHVPDMETGRCWEFRDTGQEGWILAYKRIPGPPRKSTRYTDEDADAFANSMPDFPINAEKKFKDLWPVRRWARLLDLEEGFIQTWHWDRIVLVGDAVHKVTPNAGLGLNQGWQAVASLTNILRKMLLVNPEPDTEALGQAFTEYQTSTKGMAKDSIFLSSLYTRVTAWHNTFYKVADRMGPYLGGDPLIFKLLASPIVKKGNVLDFVPEKNLVAGRIPWQKPSPPGVDKGSS
ncbi:hypothetical protein BX600DRAFT_523928 [Xylariales sp. PMI_506]|nr:hypothetical protein BX600DRAFT_523928 [Xylariales sp. PMI_506]